MAILFALLSLSLFAFMYFGMLNGLRAIGRKPALATAVAQHHARRARDTYRA